MKLNELIKSVSTSVEELEYVRELFANNSLTFLHFKLFCRSCKQAKKHLNAVKKHFAERKQPEKLRVWNECFGEPD